METRELKEKGRCRLAAPPLNDIGRGIAGMSCRRENTCKCAPANPAFEAKAGKKLPVFAAETADRALKKLPRSGRVS